MISTSPLCSFLMLSVFVFAGCANEDINHPYGVFPKTATPFKDANSAYDELGAAPDSCEPRPAIYSWPYCVFPLYLSSNRVTQGGSFDIMTMSATRDASQQSGDFDMSAMIPGPYANTPVWTTSDSPANEYGPFIMDYAGSKLYFHAGDASGNLDIYYTTTVVWDIPASALNSPSDDADLTFGPDNSFYFTSNRGGDFDLYRVEVPAGADIPVWLRDSVMVPATNIAALNTAANDKSPFVNGKRLVFASDRPGGYGGYDLYYSVYGPGGWSAPVNFGSDINSANDEYRPVVISDPDYLNDLMVFSSNRPGGVGGFDLYYVGIPKIAE